MTHGMAEIDGAESDEAESEAMYDDGTAQTLATDCAIIKARVGQVANMVEIQSQDGNWNYSDYMRGLANGLLLAHATMTGGAYKPFSRPAQWVEEAAALQARIDELEAADQWRPVSEPPDKDGEYLIYRQPDLKYQPNARPDAAMMDVADYRAGRTNAKGELNEWSHNAIFMPITHWRPLPTPPQEAPAA